MKLYCSYCGQAFERDLGKVFCKPSHKVNYHRGLGAASTARTPKEALVEVLKVIETPAHAKQIVRSFSGLCEHGSMKGLCKKGCK